MINLLKRKKSYKSSKLANKSEYLKLQYRTDPKEFLDSRRKIASSFTFIIPELIKLGIRLPVNETIGINKGQLKANSIKILDAGCRDGWTIEFLNSLGYNDVIGVELFDEYVNYCNSLGRKAVKGDLHKLEFSDNSFDFVYCRHVLEHTLDPIAVINELLRVTKPKGAIYVSFPLENEPYGKHTIAISQPGDVREILGKVRHKFTEIYVDRTKAIPLIIPEGDEMIIFLCKQ